MVGQGNAKQGNAKQGNAWLKWAFSEAAVLSAQKDEHIGKYLDKLSSRLGKAKALSALAHQLGRAFYHMLQKKEVFNIDKFLRHGATGRPASRRRTGAAVGQPPRRPQPSEEH